MSEFDRDQGLGGMPPQAAEYARLIEGNRNHLVVRSYFHEITALSVEVPGRGHAEFFALQFRDAGRAAFLWQDSDGDWGVGPWVALAAPDGDFAPELDYFAGNPSTRTFPDALVLLLAGKMADRTRG